VTAPAGFDEPTHNYLIAVTTPDHQAVAAIDLHYELAIERDPYETDGIYLDPTLTGARVVVDDGTTSAAFYLDRDECLAVSHYLLACAKAASDRQAAGS
jgi:hypothetical protein